MVALHYNDVIMSAIASQITSLTIVFSTVYSEADQRKYQRSASLAFVQGIHPGPVDSPHKWPLTRKIFPFGDVIMTIPCSKQSNKRRQEGWLLKSHSNETDGCTLIGQKSPRNKCVIFCFNSEILQFGDH